MATRSRIGVVLPNGIVQSVYCHNDGYPEGVGQRLVDTIDSYEKAKAFVDEGDHSTVDLSYNKWRDEDIVFQMHESQKEFWGSDLEEYGYLFVDGEWLCQKQFVSAGEDAEIYLY